MMIFSYNSRINSYTEYESISSKWVNAIFNVRKHFKNFDYIFFFHSQSIVKVRCEKFKYIFLIFDIVLLEVKRVSSFKRIFTWI